MVAVVVVLVLNRDLPVRKARGRMVVEVVDSTAAIQVGVVVVVAEVWALRVILEVEVIPTAINPIHTDHNPRRINNHFRLLCNSSSNLTVV